TVFVALDDHAIRPGSERHHPRNPERAAIPERGVGVGQLGRGTEVAALSDGELDLVERTVRLDLAAAPWSQGEVGSIGQDAGVVGEVKDAGRDAEAELPDKVG